MPTLDNPDRVIRPRPSAPLPALRWSAARRTPHLQPLDPTAVRRACARFLTHYELVTRREARPTSPPTMGAVTVVQLPPVSLITTSLPRIDYADAFLAQLPAGRHYTLDEAAGLVFATVPGWVKRLLQLTDNLPRHVQA